MKRCSSGMRKCHTGECVRVITNSKSQRCKRGTRKCANNKCYVQNKISFLFLTYSDILHGNVIKKYIKNHDAFIHSKYSITDSYFKTKIIPEIVETKWGDISIVYATINLLKNAFYRTTNNWFVLLSQDVYPLQKIASFEKFLSVQRNSLFEEYESVPKKNIYKTTQWWILNRNDVSIILENYEAFVFANLNFKIIQAAIDEVFFLTLLKWHNSSYMYTNFSCVYTWWIKNTTSKHPIIFNHITKETNEKIKNNRSFFIRKTTNTFSPTIYTTNKELFIIYIGTESVQNYTRLLNKNYDIIIMTSVNVDTIDKNLVSSSMFIYSIIYKLYYENLLALLDEINIKKWEKITCISEQFNVVELNTMNINARLKPKRLPIQCKINNNLSNDAIFYTLLDSNKQPVYIINNYANGISNKK